MACGTPVITSNTTSLIEVSGQATVLVDPKSIKDISQSIQKLYSDKELQQKNIDLGYINVKKYSWHSSRKTLAILTRHIY